MNSLICISHVPDTTTRIQFNDAKTELDTNGVTFVVGPYDEYGLTRGLELKEAAGSGTVTALCVGGPEVDPTIRKALAIGADNGVRINLPKPDAYTIASNIATWAKDQDYKLIFCGKESIATNASEVPAMLAELLGWAYISHATHLEANGDTLTVIREIEGGHETLEVPLPAVISCQKGIAEWRTPNMRGIMAAKKKPLDVVEPQETNRRVSNEAYDYPPPKPGVTMLEPDDVKKIVDILHDKGVI